MEEETGADRPAFDYTTATFHRFSAPPNHNKSLVFIQREQHEKKLKSLKPPETIEKLYQLEATRRQVLDVLKEEEHARNTLPQCSWHPEIDKNSEKMAEHLDPEVVNRVYNWQEKRGKKVTELTQKQKEADEKKLAESTEKFRFSSGKIEVDSKVKNFVESLDQKKASRTSKMAYQSNPSPVTGADRGKMGGQGLLTSALQYQSVPMDGGLVGKKGIVSGKKVQGGVPGEGAFKRQSKQIDSEHSRTDTREALKNMVKDI